MNNNRVKFYNKLQIFLLKIDFKKFTKDLQKYSQVFTFYLKEALERFLINYSDNIYQTKKSDTFKLRNVS